MFSNGFGIHCSRTVSYPLVDIFSRYEMKIHNQCQCNIPDSSISRDVYPDMICQYQSVLGCYLMYLSTPQTDPFPRASCLYTLLAV